jgi:hypothetical protein
MGVNRNNINLHRPYVNIDTLAHVCLHLRDTLSTNEYRRELPAVRREAQTDDASDRGSVTTEAITVGVTEHARARLARAEQASHGMTQPTHPPATLTNAEDSDAHDSQQNGAPQPATGTQTRLGRR